MSSTVESIHTAPVSGAPTVSHDQVEAIAGRGLVGDRNFDGAADPAKWGPDQEITLIEAEHVETFNKDQGYSFAAADFRRNVVTRGVALNDLVGREFRVGETVLRGHRLCEPCNYLQGRLDAPILAHMVHRGGLRAEIVKGGVIRVGDAIVVE